MGLKYSEKEILATLAGQMPENAARIQQKEGEATHKRRPTEPVEKMTGLEKAFLYWWRVVGGNPEDWLFGQKLFPERPRMHVDFYEPVKRIAIEIDGGQHMRKSGHSNGAGLRRDAEKLALCNKHRITLYRLVSDMVCYEDVKRLFERIGD